MKANQRRKALAERMCSACNGAFVLTPHQADVSNRFLANLAPEDFALLAQHLVDVPVPTRQIISQEGKAEPYVYFLESGLISVLAISEQRSIAIAMIGREGSSDVSHMHGSPSFLRSVITIEGKAWRIDAPHYEAVCLISPSIMNLRVRYQRLVTAQIAYTALFQGTCTIPERVARWILMAQDRVGAEMELVQETISGLLSVRRAGVSSAFRLLEDSGAIATKRGELQILDRDALLRVADGAYGAIDQSVDPAFAL